MNLKPPPPQYAKSDNLTSPADPDHARKVLAKWPEFEETMRAKPRPEPRRRP